MGGKTGGVATSFHMKNVCALLLGFVILRKLAYQLKVSGRAIFFFTLPYHILYQFIYMYIYNIAIELGNRT